jgi:hypothetical protein
MTAVETGKNTVAQYTCRFTWVWPTPGSKNTRFVMNPKHPYWKGREFVWWLKTKGHLKNPDSVWHRAEHRIMTEPHYIGNPNGIQSRSWFEWIDHELIGASSPDVSSDTNMWRLLEGPPYEGYLMEQHKATFSSSKE